MISRPNERQIVELFTAVRLTQSNGDKPGDIDITNRRVELDPDDEDNDYAPSSSILILKSIN